MKKEREKERDSSYAEGVLSVLAVLNCRSRPVEHIYLAEKKKLKSDRRVSAVRKIAEEEGIPFALCEKEFLQARAVGSTHGGLIAKVGDRRMGSPDDVFSGGNGFVFLLDGVEDPYNFAYAIRTFYAFGAGGMFVSARNWMSAAGVVIRGSAGASERIICARYANARELADCAGRHGYRIVCAREDGEETLRNADLKKPLLVVVGGEKRGISAELLAVASGTVAIPYGGSFAYSLTATAAAAVIAYETASQNSQ